MVDDYCHRLAAIGEIVHDQDVKKALALLLIRSLVQDRQNCDDIRYGLPLMSECILNRARTLLSHLDFAPLRLAEPHRDLQILNDQYQSLNVEQKHFIDEAQRSITQGRQFLAVLDAPAGTGKTYTR